MRSILESRRGRVDVVSACVALAVTVAGFVAVVAASAGALRLSVFGMPEPMPAREEQVTFVATPRQALPVAPPVPGSPAVPVRAYVPATEPQRSPLPTDRDTGATRVVPSRSVRPSLLPPPVKPQYLVTPPVAPPVPFNPFVPAAPPTRAQMEAKLGTLRDSLAVFADLRIMSVAERDSLTRVVAMRGVIPGRAPQMPGTISKNSGGFGGGVPVGLFSSGPSAAERRRDSAANVEYLARLRRLDDRVRARRESLRVADSMSRARMP